MRLSKHAKIRSKQRAIPKEALDIVMRHGRMSYTPGGTCKLFFGNKESALAISALKQAIKTIERAKGGTIILGDDQIITVYKQN